MALTVSGFLELLDIAHPLDVNDRCIGQTLKRQTCRNRVAIASRCQAVTLIKSLCRSLNEDRSFREDLHNLASLLHCKNWHQYQGPAKYDEWKGHIKAWQRERRSIGPTSQPTHSRPRTRERTALHERRSSPETRSRTHARARAESQIRGESRPRRNSRESPDRAPYTRYSPQSSSVRASTAEHTNAILSDIRGLLQDQRLTQQSNLSSFHAMLQDCITTMNRIATEIQTPLRSAEGDGFPNDTPAHQMSLSLDSRQSIVASNGHSSHARFGSGRSSSRSSISSPASVPILSSRTVRLVETSDAPRPTLAECGICLFPIHDEDEDEHDSEQDDDGSDDDDDDYDSEGGDNVGSAASFRPSTSAYDTGLDSHPIQNFQCPHCLNEVHLSCWNTWAAQSVESGGDLKCVFCRGII